MQSGGDLWTAAVMGSGVRLRSTVVNFQLRRARVTLLVQIVIFMCCGNTQRPKGLQEVMDGGLGSNTQGKGRASWGSPCRGGEIVALGKPLSIHGYYDT